MNTTADTIARKRILLLVIGALILSTSVFAQNLTGQTTSPQLPVGGGEQASIENPAVLVRGDPLTISGIATGQPDNVYVWIFGRNFRSLSVPVSVESDGTYRYTLDRGVTATFAPGRYFAIVQHPMINGEQDVRVISDSTISVPGGTEVNLAGLPANDAALALVNALNSPYSDDTYTMISFLVEDPWIRIDAIRSTGDR
jgi:hypothetical protein